MKFLKRPRPVAGSSSSNHPQSSGLVELASSGPGFGSGRNDAGGNSRQEPLVGAVGAESETNTRAGTQLKHPTIDGQHNDYYHSMPPQALPPGERIISPTTNNNPSEHPATVQADILLSVASSGSMPPLRVPSRTELNSQMGLTPAELYYNGTSSSSAHGQKCGPKAESGGRGTFTDEDEGNNIHYDDDDDDDEYSRYSSNYLADHNRNLRENAALTDSKYPPPSPGGRRSAAGASYDRNRSMSDYTAPFDDTEEWTPDDSAYGAACPVFGWIPKPMRKIIEATFIFVLVLIFVVVVISASIKMSNDKNGNKTGKWNGSGSGGGNKWYTDDAVSNDISDGNAKENDKQEMGDDYYVEHDGENDDNTDDYLNGDNGGGAKNNGGRGRLLLRRNDVVANGVILQQRSMAKGRDGARGDLFGRRVGNTYLW